MKKQLWHAIVYFFQKILFILLLNQCRSEVKGKAFFTSVTYGGNGNCCKSVYHPICTLPVGTKNTLIIFKTNQ